MTDSHQTISLSAGSLIAYTKNVFAEYPKYHLDLSWPSIPIIHHLLSPCNHKDTLSLNDQDLIHGVASYLGSMAFDIWKAFDPENIKLSIYEKSNAPVKDVFIKAKGGKFLPRRQEFTVNISEALRSALQSPINSSPYIANCLIALPENSNKISPFALGLFTGLCPFGTGLWRSISFDAWQRPLRITDHILAISSASNYKRVHPSDSTGTEAQIYEQGMILPPSGYAEPFPFLRATDQLIRHLKSLKLSSSEIQKLAINLAKSGDLTFSCVGFALAVANSSKSPSPQLTTVAEYMGDTAPNILPAVSLARTLLDGTLDWPELLQKGEFEKGTAQLTLEHQLGLLPLLALPYSAARNLKYLPLLKAIRANNVREASLACEYLIRDIGLSPDLSLQQVLLFHKQGSHKLALGGMLDIISKISDDNIPDKTLFANVLATLCVNTNNPSLNATFQLALLNTAKDPHIIRKSIPLLIQSLLHFGLSEQALTLANNVIQNNKGAYYARRIRYQILQAQGYEDAARLDLKHLVSNAGFDAFVFKTLHNSLMRNLSD